MTPPDGACGEYQDYTGNATWIKDLNLSNPNYPMAQVWSHTTKRWRIKREFIRMERLRLFAVPRETEQ